MSSSKKKPPNNDFWQYAGLGTEMLASIGVAVFAGYKLDHWLHLEIPVFLIIFALLALVLILWRIIKETK